MEIHSHETPQKLKTPPRWMKTSQDEVVFESGGSSSTPSNDRSEKRKGLYPRTPSHTYRGATPISSVNNSSSFHIFSNAVINTPPAKRFHRVHNPFEAALAERLHLPLIGSPSLFQRPIEPQFSSTQFEWTIDDVSSLKPVHVEAHETQFHESPDPEYEAKAQSAISSYFKEQQIVPSPVDCPLRNQRIIISEMNGDTPMSKPGRRIRDCGTQTELTLPFDLPPALAEALRPYFQPNLALVGAKLQLLPNECNKENSLRRKLFDMHNIILFDGESTPSASNVNRTTTATTFGHQSNSSPTFFATRTAIAGKLSDSLDKSSFGSISPISSVSPGGGSPRCYRQNSAIKRKTRMKSFFDDELDELEQPSPIHAPQRFNRTCNESNEKNNARQQQLLKEQYRDAANTTNTPTHKRNYDDISLVKDEHNKDNFVPERSSSPILLDWDNACNESNNRQSDNSSLTNIVGRLVVDSAVAISKHNKSDAKQSSLQLDTTVDGLDTDDLDDDEEIDIDMQASLLSTQSSNCSSANSDTPRSSMRGSASPKNLSQSFNTNCWLDDEEAEDEEEMELPQIQTQDNALKEVKPTTATTASTNSKDQRQLGVFYRTDSGFNEMSSSQNSTAAISDANQIPADISMACCYSTATTQNVCCNNTTVTPSTSIF